MVSLGTWIPCLPGPQHDIAVKSSADNSYRHRLNSAEAIVIVENMYYLCIINHKNITDMSKAILFSRVSTERQSLDEQTKEIYDMAISDGFKDEDIILIAEKESGIKLSEDERLGLNRMKEVISSEDVTCVYFWEVSRLARNKKVTFSVTDYLVKHQINLKTKVGGITLLNPDGTVNDGAEMAFSVMAIIAEGEMRGKKARIKRTTKAKANQGQFNGGKYIKYGYMVDENGFYQVKEDEAEIVRLIFDLYTSTEMGASLVRNELRSRGIYLTTEKVRRILYTQGYDGVPYIVKNNLKDNLGNRQQGNLIKYPPIITTDVWEKAVKKRETNNSKALRNENYYLARGLVKCPKCGSIYVASKNLGLYVCSKNHQGTKFEDKCDNTACIKIDVLDAILWYCVSEVYRYYLMDLDADSIEEINHEIEVLEVKRKIAERNLEKAQSKIKKITQWFIDGVIEDEKEVEANIAKVKAQMADDENNIVVYNAEIEKNIRLISSIQKKDEYTAFVDADFETDAIESRRKIYDIIRLFVDSVDFVQGEKFKRVTVNFNALGVTLMNGERCKNFLTKYYGKKWEILENVNGEYLNVTGKVKLIPRV